MGENTHRKQDLRDCDFHFVYLKDDVLCFFISDHII